MTLEIALSHQYTERQKAFAELAATGIDLHEAARQAGYQGDDIPTLVARMMRQPQILAAVQIAVARQLATAAPAALKLLRDVVADTSCDKRLRVACAKTILDRAGHIAPKAAAAPSAGAVPLNEMSMADLRSLADKLESELAGRAKEVSSAKPAPKPAQTLDDII